MKYDRRPRYPKDFSEYPAVPCEDEHIASLVKSIIGDVENDNFNCNYITTGDIMVVGDLEGNIYVCKVLKSYESFVTTIEETV